MAIKVKHEGSAASRMAASAQGGAAKRAMEAAALVKPTQIQTLSPAHVSAPSAGGAHAQLISAPGGGAHAQLIGGGGGIGAHARMGGGVGGRGGGGAGSRVSTGAGGGDLDYKVTGTSIFNRPDDESQWDPTGGGRWVRKWLPGEKEAEARGRIMDAEFTSRQRAEWSELNNAIQDIQASESYTPNEKRELIRQIEAKRAGIKPLPSLPQISAEDEMNANTIERNGVLFDRSGKVLYNPHEIEMKRMDAQMKRYTDMATKLQQGRRVSKLEENDSGEKKWVTVYEPISQEEQDEILGRFFPDIHVRSQGESGSVVGSGTDMGNALAFTIGLNGTPTSAPGTESTYTPAPVQMTPPAKTPSQAAASASAEEGSQGEQEASDWKKKLGW